MKTYLGRAMQVSYLTQEQLEKLQTREKIRGYLIPNWNIQSVFGIPSIKERYGIPDNNENQIQHNNRIDKELQAKGFLKTGEFYEDGLDWNHAFDWAVFKRAHEIVWDYSGGKSKYGKKILGSIEEE